MAGLNAAAWIDKIRDSRLRHAFRGINRADFLDTSLRPRAADNRALPIGHAQTTSQPQVIVQMLEMLLATADTGAVLEIGAGCGYQTAILASLYKKVVAMERIRPLAKQTSARLRAMGYNNVHVIHGDGFNGYAAAAPFDGIVICAESAIVPDAAVSQLSPTGRLIMPLSTADNCRLVAINADGAIVARRGMVDFVPMLKGTT